MSRKQAKLAARAAERAALLGNPRPFENVDAEADFIAFREFVPAAELPVTVADSERTINICTVLPGGAAALVREEQFGGDALVAMQTQNRSSDVADDLARALVWARDAKPGETLESVTVEGSAAKALDVPPLSEVLLDVDVDGLVIHEDFNWWIPEGVEKNPMVEQNLRMANDAIIPSYRVEVDVPGAVWWVDPGDRAHIRWIRREEQNKLLDALARVHAADNLTLGEGSKFAGVFRTEGVLVPVWDLDNTVHHSEWAEGASDLQARLEAALASEEQLTADERKSRETIVSRQVTLR